MIRILLLLIVVLVLLNVVSGDNENMSIEKIYELAQNVLNATEKWQQDLKEYSIEGRKSKLLPFGLLPFQALCEYFYLHTIHVICNEFLHHIL